MSRKRTEFNYIIARRDKEKLIPFSTDQSAGRGGASYLHFGSVNSAAQMLKLAKSIHPEYFWRVYPLHTILRDVHPDELGEENLIEAKEVKKKFEWSGRWDDPNYILRNPEDVQKTAWYIDKDNPINFGRYPAKARKIT